MAYKHLGLEERHYIKLQSKTGVSRKKIAKPLSRSQSAVSRDILRNTGHKGYRHKQAYGKATRWQAHFVDGQWQQKGSTKK